MAGFNIHKLKTDSSSAETREKPIPASVEDFVSASPDISSRPAWQTPIDGQNWMRRERSIYNLFLSPPQKKALELVKSLKHSASMQEYAMLLLERAIMEELKTYSDPAVGGLYAEEARKALEYLQTWGDTAIGRKSPGERSAI